MNRHFVRSSRLIRRPRFRSARFAIGSRGALQPSSLADLNPEQFQAELTALEAAVQNLRQHFDQIDQIQQQQQALNQQLTRPSLPVTELQAIHQQLETLEAELVSTTLPWQILAEPFWQAIRFGGVGLVIGWFLKGVVQGQ